MIPSGFVIRPLHAMAALTVSLAMLAGVCAQAQTQDAYPSKQLRIVAPFSAGSGVDSLARIYARQLAEQLHVPVIVENKEGAGGMIGAAYAAKLPGDGYTLLVATTPFVVGPISQGNAGYDPFKDFTSVAGVAHNPLALAINPSVPAATMKDLITYARAHPGVLTYASSGPGTPSQLEMEALKSQLRLDIREIPYRSNSQAMTDVMAGFVSMYYTVQSTTLGNLRAGKLRALAVAAARPTQALPEVPTMADAAGLPDYEALVWYGFVAPAGTPPELVARLHAEIERATQVPAVADGIKALGFEPVASSPTEFAAQMKREGQKWAAPGKSAAR